MTHYDDQRDKHLSMHDTVNHPTHYTNHPSGVECIQITEHMSFLVGNIIKYVWRADSKNGVEDLKKARWYLDREIKSREEAADKLEESKTHYKTAIEKKMALCPSSNWLCL